MMNRMKCLIMVLTPCFLLAMCQQVACGDDLGHKEETGVTIALNKLDVNDTTLDLRWTIKNDSDHDVWICDSVDVNGVRIESDFETFLDEDAKTLLIRRRFDVPEEVIWELDSDGHPTGRYVRLRQGQKRTEFLSLNVPVRPQRAFARERANAEYARCLVLEIGFYDEDLPGMIRSIIELAEKLNCTRLTLDDIGIENTGIYDRYFSGLGIAAVFRGLPGLNESLKDEFIFPYLFQILKGEQVLRIKVVGMSIPYNAERSQQTSGRKQDKPVRENG